MSSHVYVRDSPAAVAAAALFAVWVVLFAVSVAQFGYGLQIRWGGLYIGYLTDLINDVVVMGLSATAIGLWVYQDCWVPRKAGDKQAARACSVAKVEASTKTNNEASSNAFSNEVVDEEEQSRGDLEEGPCTGDAPQDPESCPSEQQQDIVQRYLSKRSPYLDMLKIIMTVLVVLGHSGEAAGGLGGAPWCPTLNVYSNSLLYVAYAFGLILAPTLMPLFFFISGIFTLSSFNRKGFAEFLKDKLKRLALPALIDLWALGPLSNFITSKVTGYSSSYEYRPSPSVTWFLTYLCLFNLAFALVWRSRIGKGDQAIRDWFGKVLRFDSTLYLWIMGLAVVGGIVNWSAGGRGFLARSASIGEGWVIWMAYFFGGVYAGAQGWLKNFIEISPDTTTEPDAPTEPDGPTEESTMTRAMRMISCSKITWGIFYLLGGGVALYLLRNEGSEGLMKSPSLTGSISLMCSLSVMALALNITVLTKSFHVFKTVNVFTLFMGQAAYAVYVFHPPILVGVVALWIYILEAGFGISIEFGNDPSNFTTSSTRMSEGLIWLGFFFIVIVTQVIVWPLAFVVRKLPLLNQIL